MLAGLVPSYVYFSNAFLKNSAKAVGGGEEQREGKQTVKIPCGKRMKSSNHLEY